MEAPRDWGLSAELVQLLAMPVIQMLLQWAGVSKRELEEKTSILRRALRETLADYGNYHEVFRCTHGLSVGAYLSEQVARRIGPRQVERLDKQIIEAAPPKICSEQMLHRLAQCIFSGKLVTEHEDQEGASPIEAKMLTELFVSTLAAGDHTPEDHWNEGSCSSTIAYFNRSNVKPNPAAVSGIHDTLFRRLLHVCGPFVGEHLRVLDLGCGNGLAARWLMEKGFDVTLVDGSDERLGRASENLNLIARGRPVECVCADVRSIHNHFSKSSFNLVVANALLVHIAPKHASGLIAKVYDVLKPGGHFFFNVKIRDHSLVSLDGRYFAYYPNFTIPRSMLRTAGFEVDEVALRENHQTCYSVPKEIQWANFYCRKPG
jgi:SAM-dependent methyltransferase